MITIGELQNICSEIEKEYGADTYVIIKGGLNGKYAKEVLITKEGHLILKA
ncbi:MAG: hypothetical protein PHE79_08665 [Eubacteriales bacterium]|nr:hypothetical protein [Eubacteriales bacterium]